MIYLYRLLYFFLKIILILLRPFLPSKIKLWIDLRSQKNKALTHLNQTYWFHASSGEIEYCKSVIRLLKEQQPGAQIVVTYSSPSAEKLFYNILPFVEQFLPLCWDTPHSVKNLIKYINPKFLIFSKTDLWPELITQAHQLNISIGVISYNPKFNFINNLINSYLLNKFSFISVIDQKIKNNLIQIGIHRNISVDGDTRFDQVFYRLSQETKLKFNSTSKIFVCGSTWPEDENVLFSCFQKITDHDIKIVLCPHEITPATISHLQKELELRNLKYQLLSQEVDLLQISLNTPVFIIDKIGYLADVYREATIAFVGGSFKEKIHSVMEPLCCGLPVITGPFYQNNPEAVKYQNRFVFTASNQEEILNILFKSLSLTKIEILNEMKKNRDSSLNILKLL